MNLYTYKLVYLYFHTLCHFVTEIFRHSTIIDYKYYCYLNSFPECKARTWPLDRSAACLKALQPQDGEAARMFSQDDLSGILYLI